MTDPIHDVVICGAGPGGLVAARVLCDAGARVAIIDEQPRAGGQFLRQPPATFRVGGWLASDLYAKGKAALHAIEDAAAVDWHFGTVIHGLFREADHWRIWASNAAGMVDLRARRVLVATGCYDMPVPFPGWTLPGVMSAGGIQTFIKSPQVLPGKRFALAGSHPLLLVLADQIVKAGGEIAALCLSQSLAASLGLLRSPVVMAENPGKFMATAKIMLALRRAGVPIRFESAITRASGNDCVMDVEIARLDRDGIPTDTGREVIACDAVGTCYGFLASSELARQAGAEAIWDPRRGGWIIPVDDWQQSSVPGLYAAGEVTAVEGSDMAMAEGEIAALAIARDLGLMSDAAVARAVLAPRRDRLQYRRFAATLTALSTPPAGLLRALRGDDVLVCRCEDLKAGDLKEALSDNAFIHSPSALKLLTRSGMGPCQGRMCGHTVIDLMQESGALQPGAQPAGFTPRAPVKPFGLWTLG